jgi:hypothetical protein
VRGILSVAADRAGALPIERLHRIAYHPGDRDDLVGGEVALVVEQRGGLVADRAGDLVTHILGGLDHALRVDSAVTAGGSGGARRAARSRSRGELRGTSH